MRILTGILGPLQVATFSTLILFISSESGVLVTLVCVFFYF